jgi:hypothetical protein
VGDIHYTTVRIPISLHKRLEKHRACTKLSYNSLLLAILEVGMDEMEKVTEVGNDESPVLNHITLSVARKLVAG